MLSCYAIISYPKLHFMLMIIFKFEVRRDVHTSATSKDFVLINILPVVPDTLEIDCRTTGCRTQLAISFVRHYSCCRTYTHISRTIDSLISTLNLPKSRRRKSLCRAQERHLVSGYFIKVVRLGHLRHFWR